MGGRFTALLVAASLVFVGCGSDEVTGPSIEDGGLPVYSVGAPRDLQTLDVAEALHDVLDVPEEVDAGTRGRFEARFEGEGHRGIVYDRKAGSVGVSYSGPRFSNTECIDCPLLDETDDAATAIELSEEILDAIGVDTADVVFSEGTRTDVDYLIVGDVVIEGAIIDDLSFTFYWTHGHVLERFVGGLYTVETIGTVAGRPESDARAQAEQMVGSANSITDFEMVYTGGFRDGELIVAPSYLATTDLGTTFAVSAFTGELPT